jgi:hypothetical protein
MIGKESAAGQSVSEHLFLWLARNGPAFLDDLRESWGAKTAKAVLFEYLQTGDRGCFMGVVYRDRTRRTLAVDFADHLRRWVKTLTHDPDKVCWMGRDPSEGWRPVMAEQLCSILPSDHLGEAELMRAFEALLPAIYAGVFDFGGERHRVRVFPRTASTGRVRDPIHQQRLTAMAIVKAKRQPGEGLTTAAHRLIKEGTIKLPGTGDYANLVRELVRVG